METFNSSTDNEIAIERKFMETMPQFGGAIEAISNMSKELEMLAVKHGLSIEKFLKKAEDSEIENEDYLNALFLSRRICRLKEKA